MNANHPLGAVGGEPLGPSEPGSGLIESLGLAPCGPWARPPWALVGRVFVGLAVVDPLGLVGLALMGQALVGPVGPDLVGRTLVGPLGPCGPTSAQGVPQAP